MEETLELVINYEWRTEPYPIKTREAERFEENLKKFGKDFRSHLRQKFDKVQLNQGVNFSRYYDGVTRGEDTPDYSNWNGTITHNSLEYDINLYIANPGGLIRVTLRTQSLVNLDGLKASICEYISPLEKEVSNGNN